MPQGGWSKLQNLNAGATQVFVAQAYRQPGLES